MFQQLELSTSATSPRQSFKKDQSSIDISTPVTRNISSLYELNSIKSNKPKVNFHSIEDLALSNSVKHDFGLSLNDSGFMSSLMSSFLTSSFTCSTPCNTSNHTRHLNKEPSEENNDSRNQYNDGKKLRTTFTENQKSRLEEYFSINPYPDPKETEDLSQNLNLPESVIKVWFQNKRSRNKQKKSTVSKIIHPVATDSPIISSLRFLSSQC